MRHLRHSVVAAAAALSMLAAHAADNALLIQMQPDGSLKVWHTEGETRISEEEVLALELSAKPEGGEEIVTLAGKARAFETKQGVVIEVPDAKVDKALLLERDACGGTKIWHTAGATNLSNDQLTEVVLGALPGGGKIVPVGEHLARGYIMGNGIIVAVWKPVVRPRKK